MILFSVLFELKINWIINNMKTICEICKVRKQLYAYKQYMLCSGCLRAAQQGVLNLPKKDK